MRLPRVPPPPVQTPREIPPVCEMQLALEALAASTNARRLRAYFGGVQGRYAAVLPGNLSRAGSPRRPGRRSAFSARLPPVRSLTAALPPTGKYGSREPARLPARNRRVGGGHARRTAGRRCSLRYVPRADCRGTPCL